MLVFILSQDKQSPWLGQQVQVNNNHQFVKSFYDVNEGAVKIDGYDVRDVTLRSLRKQMG